MRGYEHSEPHSDNARSSSDVPPDTAPGEQLAVQAGDQGLVSWKLLG